MLAPLVEQASTSGLIRDIRKGPKGGPALTSKRSKKARRTGGRGKTK